MREITNKISPSFCYQSYVDYVARWTVVQIMLVNGESLIQRCPVVGNIEETGWNMQCPMANQWPGQLSINNYSNYNQYSDCNEIPVQCYNRNYYVPENIPQQYYPPVVYTTPPPIQVNLPCHQKPDWDYNSMCFNVNGQPCQYTDVVDLEDFM